MKGKYIKKNYMVIAIFTLMTTILFTYHLHYKKLETVYPSNQLIRLHIVANSDCSVDQELKRKIRDEIIRCFTPDLLGAQNIDAARRFTLANLDHIQAIASREIKAQGKNYPVNVQLGSFTFPTKHYGPFVLPAGEYESVQVIIGSGGGANWWCVLFPPLCFVDMPKMTVGTLPENINAAAAPPVPGEQASAAGITAESLTTSEDASEAIAFEDQIRVDFRFKIVEIYKSLFY